MTNTPRSRRPAGLAAGFGVLLAAPILGVLLTLPVPAPGPALADCTLGFIDNPATPGQCVPIPGEGQERSTADPTTAPSDPVADPPNGADVSACDLNQPYQNTVCPGPDGTTNVTAPLPGTHVGDANGADLSACALDQPYPNTMCPGAPQP